MSDQDGPLLTSGQRLRDARLQRGLSLTDVATQTRIAPEILEAIEADQAPEHLAPLYVRSFLRAYALAVGLTPEDVIALHDRAAGKQTEAAEPVWEEEVQVRRVGGPGAAGWLKWLLLVVLAAVAVVIAARVLDRVGSGSRRAAEAPAGLAPQQGFERPAARDPGGEREQAGVGEREQPGGGDRASSAADTLPYDDEAGPAGAGADSSAPPGGR